MYAINKRSASITPADLARKFIYKLKIEDKIFLNGIERHVLLKSYSMVSLSGRSNSGRTIPLMFYSLFLITEIKQIF